MKLIFAGTPTFAVAPFLSLIEAGHEIALVLTQPDKPAGRKMLPQASPVKIAAQQHYLKVAQPDSLKYPEAQSLIRGAEADLMIVAAYGLLLPSSVLAIPKYGCINIHASLLPRWRGAAPIQRAIETGDKETGITIMKMDAGLDAGDILSWQSIPILSTDNAASLTDRLAQLGAQLLIKTLDSLDQITPIAQPTTGISYAHKIQKTESRISWHEHALTIVHKIHALNPTPGTLTYLNQQLIKVWDAALHNEAHDKPPGTILALTKTGIIVAAGAGAVKLTLLQCANAKRLPAEALIHGHLFEVGQQFDA